ncbi:MAG: hypothetical protein J6X31_02765 [Bacteroidales bacterium]|nr:hypothetical protein [Bacteroidales bacterium]
MAFSWTTTALFSEVASKRMGSLHQKVTLWEVVGAFICVFGVALFFL